MPDGRTGDAGSERRDRAGDLVAHDRRRRERDFRLHHVQVGVAHAARAAPARGLRPRSGSGIGISSMCSPPGARLEDGGSVIGLAIRLG